MMVKNYIFDFDGTLVDSMSYWFITEAEYLKINNLKLEGDYLQKMWSMTINQEAEFLINHFGLNKTVPQIASEIYEIMIDHYKKDVKTKEGVVELIKNLKAQGSKLIIFTQSSEKGVRPCLKANGIEEYFDDIISTQDLGLSKKKIETYEHVIKRVGCDLKDIIYFEDSLYSIELAKKAGIYTIGTYEDLAKDNWEKVKEVSDEAYESLKDYDFKKDA